MERLREFRSSFWYYDFFGYMLPGFFFICLFIIDYDSCTLMRYNTGHPEGLFNIHDEPNIHFKLEYLFDFLTWKTVSDIKFTSVFMLILFCYVLGHILSAISSFFIERLFNQGALGFPSENLLNSEVKKNCLQRLFSNYTRSYPTEYILKFKDKYEKRFGHKIENKDTFWLCFAEITSKSPMGFNRVIHFVNLYGFTRNIAGAFFTYIVLRLLAWKVIDSKVDIYTVIILVSYLIFGLIMTKNYLKLFQRQCNELYYHFYSMQTDCNQNN